MTDLETIGLGRPSEEQEPSGEATDLVVDHEYRPSTDAPTARDAVGTREHDEHGAFLDD